MVKYQKFNFSLWTRQKSIKTNSVHCMIFDFINPLLVTVNHCAELCWEPEMNSYTRQAVGGKWQEESIREVDILGPSPYPIRYNGVKSFPKEHCHIFIQNTIPAFGDFFSPKSIWDKSQFYVPMSKTSEKVRVLLLYQF